MTLDDTEKGGDVRYVGRQPERVRRRFACFPALCYNQICYRSKHIPQHGRQRGHQGQLSQYQHRFYYLEFIRSAGVKTAAEKDLQITNCPNCGAPTQVTSSGECEYCHSVITNGDFGWVLNQYMAW